MHYQKYIYSFLFVFLCIAGTAHAQSNHTLENQKKQHFFNSDIEYSLRAHFSIGGSSPMGFPIEIRKIESYNPTLQLGLEANATKWLTDQKDWALRLGLSVEGKGMSTKARVKNYFTEIIQDKSRIQGYYTGLVQTDVSNTYLTIPISAVYTLSDRWNLYGGLFASAAIDKQFDGYVSEGYLRQGSPVGTKITFEEESTAAYDFSDELRTFQWGMQAGAEWELQKSFTLFTDLSYGFNNIFNKDFKAISFSMHNLYLNLGFGYTF